MTGDDTARKGPARGRTTHARPAHERPTGERPVHDGPAGDGTAGVHPTGRASGGPAPHTPPTAGAQAARPERDAPARPGRAAASAPQIPPRLLPGYPGYEHWHRVPATGQHYIDVGSLTPAGTGRAATAPAAVRPARTAPAPAPVSAPGPVLLLHSTPLWSYAWRRLLPVLSPHRRCIAPDLPGLGLSPRTRLPDAPAERAEAQLGQLDALLEHLVHERGLPARDWTLIVHGWGGVLGSALARRRPGIAGRVVALNSVAFPSAEHRLPLSLRWMRASRPVGAAARAVNAVPRVCLRAGAARRLPAEVRRAYLRPYARLQDRRAPVEYVRGIPRRDDDPAWRLLGPPDGRPDPLAEVPLLVGWGMRDPVFTPQVLAEWQHRFPHASVCRYPYAGHFVMEDAATELGVHIRDFLLETDS